MYAAGWHDIEGKPVNEVGAKGVTIRVLIGDNANAPNFVMRHYEIAQGGSTPYHTHSWEHEVFVLSGKGTVRHRSGEKALEAGSFVFVAPGEEHAFSNSGVAPFVFLCVIPRPKQRPR